MIEAPPYSRVVEKYVYTFGLDGKIRWDNNCYHIVYFISSCMWRLCVYSHEVLITCCEILCIPQFNVVHIILSYPSVRVWIQLHLIPFSILPNPPPSLPPSLLPSFSSSFSSFYCSLMLSPVASIFFSLPTSSTPSPVFLPVLSNSHINLNSTLS